jgi:tRNA modification GTPase
MSDLAGKEGGAFYQLLTATGRGAIAVVRVSGPRAVAISDLVFRASGSTRLAQCRVGRLMLGHIGDGLGDEVVAVKLEGETPIVEIQCHGGIAAVALVQAALEKAGAQPAKTGWPGPTDPNAGLPLAKLALLDLTYAPTLTTAEILLDQANGSLHEEVCRLVELIEEHPAAALAGVQAIEARAAVGLRLLSGWKVVITGRPNVGKSRLLNALAGFTRAIVDPTPGTTRDVVSFQTSVAGWPVELADTAGIRATSDTVEILGIERTREQQRQSDMVILVLDRSEPLQPIDRELIATTSEAILVANKSDLPPAWPAEPSSLDPRPILMISAERGDGIPSLLGAVVKRLIPDPPPPGSAVPFRPEQVESLSRAKACLQAGDRSGAEVALQSLIDTAKMQDNV